LSVQFSTETAHLGDSPQKVAAVTRKAQVPVAHKSWPVINDPIVGVLAGRIKGRPVGMAGLAVQIVAETADLRDPP
jgi:hypothetical protein